MGNTLTMQKQQIVQTLHSLGWSNRRINNETGIHRDTIARIIKQEELQSLSFTHKREVSLAANDQQNHNQSGCKPYENVIKSKINQGLSIQRIYQDLVTEHNFKYSYSCVRRFVGSLTEKQVEVFARIHSNPGEEAQVDFGQGAPVKVGEHWRKPWLFVMVLSYSRRLYAEVVWSQDVETFIRCHERAFLVFGGVTAVVRLDNLKSGVIKASLYEPELNMAYAAYAKHAGFSPLPCLPRRPEHKGKTEAGVKYVQENALKGMQFCSLEIQNAHLREWNKNWADQRIHGTTQIQVLKLFEEEKSYLKPLPVSNFVFFKVGCRTVQSDSHISFDKAYYSVPHQYVGKKVIVHSSIDAIKILNESGELLTIHQRKQKGNFSTEKEHFPEKKRYSRQEYQHKILKECEEIGSNCLKWAYEVIEKREALASRAIGGLLGLKKKFQSNVIEQACLQAIELGSIELYTVIILCQGAELNSKKLLAHEDESIRALSEYESILDDWEAANGNA